MSIILAIEPDRRRAAQLTAMARAHLRAEVLVAATTAEAVTALDGRVPDVLLTAPLLPSQEEAAMAEYLRQLGSAATHVQTLTIPLLAGAGDRDRPVLSAFRRDRTSRSEPEGCDPAVFAEQITEYLREARERRETPTPAPRQAPAVETTEVTRLATAKNGTIARLLAAAAVEEDPEDFKEFLLPPVPSVPIALPADEFNTDLDVTIAAVDTVAPDIKLPPSGYDFATDEITTFQPDIVVTGSEQSTDFVTFAVGDGDTEPSHIAPVISPAVSVVTRGLRRPARRAHSLEDGWGFFDPNQCGFPALIAKLDEIASRDGDS